MAGKKIELPEQEIIDTYKKSVWWTTKKLAKKYETTEYRINKILKAAGVLRQTVHIEKLIIERLLKYERRFDKNTFGREMMLARKLIEKCPDENFWKSLDIGFQLNSLAFLESEQGKAILRKKYSEFKFEIQKTSTHNIGEEKVGEDIEIVKKPLSLKDFLKS